MITDDFSGIQITDLAAVQQALAEIYKVFGILPHWRGHAEFDWKLWPEVFRPTSSGGQYPEDHLILTFMARAESRHQRCPPRDDAFAWLSLARHYGLPTRLMDWSASPLIALYFAVTNDKKDDKDGCLWALHASRMNRQMLNQHMLLYPENVRVREIAGIALRGDWRTALSDRNSKIALAVGPREIDYRMLVQQGVFTIHADANDLAEVQYSNRDGSTDPPKPWRCAFRIPARAKKHLREVLTMLGIRKSTLFPDLGALTEELKEGSDEPPAPT